jgi:hypothetical protein
MKGYSQRDAAQGVEGVVAVLPGRGDISADTAEVHEGVKAAIGAGDLLPQLHHSQITLRKDNNIHDRGRGRIRAL